MSFPSGNEKAPIRGPRDVLETSKEGNDERTLELELERKWNTDKNCAMDRITTDWTINS